jgi:hypothetical protein
LNLMMVKSTGLESSGVASQFFWIHNDIFQIRIPLPSHFGSGSGPGSNH